MVHLRTAEEEGAVKSELSARMNETKVYSLNATRESRLFFD